MAIDVKQPKGYRKAWNGSPPKPTLAELVARLRDHLRRSEMGYTERYDLDAERFYKLTGYMAPGKSVPMEMAGSFSDEDREAAWRAWCELLRDEFHADLRAVIAALEPKEPTTP